MAEPPFASVQAPTAEYLAFKAVSAPECGAVKGRARGECLRGLKFADEGLTCGAWSSPAADLASSKLGNLIGLPVSGASGAMILHCKASAVRLTTHGVQAPHFTKIRAREFAGNATEAGHTASRCREPSCVQPAERIRFCRPKPLDCRAPTRGTANWLAPNPPKCPPPRPPPPKCSPEPPNPPRALPSSAAPKMTALIATQPAATTANFLSTLRLRIHNGCRGKAAPEHSFQGWGSVLRLSPAPEPLGR